MFTDNNYSDLSIAILIYICISAEFLSCVGLLLKQRNLIILELEWV